MKKLSLLFIIPVIVIAFMYFSAKSPSVGNTQTESGILPNPTLTPGAINPQVTQSNISETICVSGWTATIRPPSSYTTALKKTQLGIKNQTTTGDLAGHRTTTIFDGSVQNNGQSYYNGDSNLSNYEEDHLISLELGGNPTDPKNLWPESYTTTPNARQKDQTESYLKRQVCAGKITLAEAQKEISTNWVAVYNSMSKTFGATENVSDQDDN